jgi:ribosomal protein L37AE/L43A
MKANMQYEKRAVAHQITSQESYTEGSTLRATVIDALAHKLTMQELYALQLLVELRLSDERIKTKRELAAPQEPQKQYPKAEFKDGLWVEAKVQEQKHACLCCGKTDGVHNDWTEPNGEWLCEGCAQDFDKGAFPGVSGRDETSSPSGW